MIRYLYAPSFEPNLRVRRLPLARAAAVDILKIKLKTLAISAFVWSAAAMPTPAKAEENKRLKVASLDTRNQIHKPITTYPRLFGAAETRNEDLSAFTKWAEVRKRFKAERKKPSTTEVREWNAMLDTLSDASIEEKITQVNDFINETKFVHDVKNWGRGDYWATPAEFFLRGGDCEDFALAKYFSLRALGVPENKMRIAIVHDNELNVPHALLIVYTRNGAKVLDNQEKSIKTASRSERYRPIFSLSATAWWRHG